MSVSKINMKPSTSSFVPRINVSQQQNGEMREQDNRELVCCMLQCIRGNRFSFFKH